MAAAQDKVTTPRAQRGTRPRGTASKPKAETWRARIVDSAEVDPRALVAHPRNWRSHPASQRAAINGVLSDVGWVSRVLVNRTTGLMIDGHLRVEEAIRSGAPTVPVDYVELDEREEAVVLATLDPIGAMATTERERLGEVLQLAASEDERVQAVLASLMSSNGILPEIPEEPIPVVPMDEPCSRRGDLWILGTHRLLCGESESPEQLDRLLAGAEVHLVNTDPPYNVKVEPRSNNAIAAGLSSFQMTASAQLARAQARGIEAKPTASAKKKSKATGRMRPKDRPLEDDFLSEDEFNQKLAGWFGNLARVLLPGRSFYIWGGYANCANYPPVLKASGLYFSQSIIWVKEHPVLTRKDFMGNHEWCFYGWREGAAHRFFGPANVPDVWSVKKVNPQAMVHLTEKPVELAVRAIQYSSRPGENVLDLFGGSGSTLIAAEHTGRRAFLMDKDPAYCDVIVKRWEQLKGGKAVLERQLEAVTS